MKALLIMVDTIVYDGMKYQVADIPDVIAGSGCRLLIGSQSLNIALYNDGKGYQNSTAEVIDEQIYAYLDDRLFSLREEDFLIKVKELLD